MVIKIRKARTGESWEKILRDHKEDKWNANKNLDK